VFYRCIEKGYAEKVYFSINLLLYCDDVKDKFEDCRKELNNVLPLYLSKGANKQTLKFKNKEIISLFNNCVSKIETNEELKDFYHARS
jgi:hypothetical protein